MTLCSVREISAQTARLQRVRSHEIISLLVCTIVAHVSRSPGSMRESYRATDDRDA